MTNEELIKENLKLKERFENLKQEHIDQTIRLETYRRRLEKIKEYVNYSLEPEEIEGYIATNINNIIDGFEDGELDED